MKTRTRSSRGHRYPGSTMDADATPLTSPLSPSPSALSSAPSSGPPRRAAASTSSRPTRGGGVRSGGGRSRPTGGYLYVEPAEHIESGYELSQVDHPTYPYVDMDPSVLPAPGSPGNISVSEAIPVYSLHPEYQDIAVADCVEFVPRSAP